MNIWKTTLLLVLLFTGITVHAQKVKISLNSDGNLTIWKVKAQAEIERYFRNKKRAELNQEPTDSDD